MPIWGWILLAVAAAIIIPIKMKVMKKIFAKSNDNHEEE